MTMAEVFPDLWLGSLASLSDIATGISSGSHRQHWTVISILDSPKLVTFAESMLKDTVEQGRCYHVVWKLPDHPSAPFLSSELKSIVVQIDKVLLHSEGDNEASGACLVHCAKGVSRSVATVAAWYISRKNVSMAEALDRIRKNSQLEALPNMGFLASLRALEQSHGNIDRAIERMESRKQQMILDVVIIGSGPAGLVSAKTLLGEGITNIMVFEETSCAGGLWNREGGTTNSDSASVQPRVKVSCVIKNDKTGEAAMEIPASVQPVYDNLTSNFPKDMTSFIGYPFEPCIEHFPNANKIALYYQSYGMYFGVDRVTAFHTRVVHCTKDTARQVWKIETSHVVTGERQEYLTKRLLVCNGHFRKAFAPYAPGLEHFKGRMLHSSAFSSPLDFKGVDTILIVGGGISGADISRTLLCSGCGAKVVMSVRKWKLPQDVLLPRLQRSKGLVVCPGVDYIDCEGNVHFREIPPQHCHKYDTISSSVRLRPDVVLFATGYRYYFPFFDNTALFLSSDGFKMENLYRRVLSCSDPSLGFVGITNVNFSPALSMEYQARWFTKVVVKDDCRSLNTTVMQKEIDSRRNDKTQDALGRQFPSYCNSLASEAGLQGYWMQMICYRLPLFIRTSWASNASCGRIVLIFSAVGVPLLGVSLMNYCREMQS